MGCDCCFFVWCCFVSIFWCCLVGCVAYFVYIHCLLLNHCGYRLLLVNRCGGGNDFCCVVSVRSCLSCFTGWSQLLALVGLVRLCWVSQDSSGLQRCCIGWALFLKVLFLLFRYVNPFLFVWVIVIVDYNCTFYSRMVFNRVNVYVLSVMVFEEIVENV